MRKQKRVVITGVGIVAPGAIGKKKFWENLKKGKSAIKPITLFNTPKTACRMSGEITSFDIRNILGKKGLRNLTRGTKFALAASKLALDDAALPSPVPNDITDSYGVSFGCAAVSVHSAVTFDIQTLTEGPRSVNPPEFPNTTQNVTASQISIRFNIQGFNVTVAAFFSSSLEAIFYAYNMIREYKYKVVLAGGAEELTPEMFTGFSKLNCLARGGSRKSREMSCPYDKRRNGLIFGEGAAILIIEDLEHAIARKARIYAEVKGFGSSFDPETMNTKGITSVGATEVIKQAMREAGCSTNEIDCIIGSANSTKRFDAIEAQAIKSALKEKSKEIPVTSIKSIIGEAFGAGGVFNAAAAAVALKKGVIPPTINYSIPDKRCNLNIIAKKAVKRRLNNVLINSFSHEGHNSSLIIGRYDK